MQVLYRWRLSAIALLASLVLHGCGDPVPNAPTTLVPALAQPAKLSVGSQPAELSVLYPKETITYQVGTWKVLRHIGGGGGAIGYDPRGDLYTATFARGLRMFPPGMSVPRWTAGDVLLPIEIVAASGSVYVSNGQNEGLNPDYIEQYSTKTGSKLLTYPTGAYWSGIVSELSVDEHGNIYAVTESGFIQFKRGSAISWKSNYDGNYLAIGVDRQSQLYVYSDSPGNINVYSRGDKTLVRTISAPPEGAFGLLINDSGELVAPSGNQIAVYAPGASTPTYSIPFPNDTYFLWHTALDNAGDIFVRVSPKLDNGYSYGPSVIWEYPAGSITPTVTPLPTGGTGQIAVFPSGPRSGL